ncbi:MAG: transporter associated domain-containing protein, partial [Sphaerospermopsis kisseleviana]
LVQMSEKQTFLVQAQINLEDLNEVLHINLPLAREYQTLGGFVLFSSLVHCPSLSPKSCPHDNVKNLPL